MTDFFAIIGMVFFYSLLFALFRSLAISFGAPDVHALSWLTGALTAYATCETHDYIRRK